MLLQIFVGIVLLELYDVNLFSLGIIFTHMMRMMLLSSVSEKQRTNISTDCSFKAPK